MHSLVRRYIKTAIGFLGIGLAIGVWLIIERDLLGRYPTPLESSAHTHALLVGFVMEMILGVALWLFPRPAKEDVRYSPRLAELAYWLVTVGTAGRVAGELTRGYYDSRTLHIAIVLLGIAQALGLVVFFQTMWSRIRPLGSAAREKAGERF